MRQIENVRRCERSEAILGARDCFGAKAPRNDGFFFFNMLINLSLETVKTIFTR